ncbi:MAG: biopolymer transporter ExbD [Sulfitobacter sp.]|nr:biopolymer transporter ExbD [Sulfitobacter sp.]
MFAFAARPPRRRVALTPLIDVVFLLLVFFMLAAQFGRETALDLTGGGGAGDYSGPPRLVTILPEDLLLNGQPRAETEIATALAELTESPDDLIILRPAEGVDVQRLTDLATLLTAAGFTRLVLVE